MLWTKAIEHCHAEGVPVVLVTLTEVRGHAPQAPGAKMVVCADRTWGTVGGGNLEASAVDHARALLSADAVQARVDTSHFDLNEHAPNRHGSQCCGGKVSLILEVLPAPPAVAIFGMGHVGTELARILARHPLRLHLIDSRADTVISAEAALRDEPVADLTWHHAPVPEVTLGELPTDSQVLIMTHDHAEDIALVDSALRCSHLAGIGLIGSSAKWRRFEARLRTEGHSPEAIAAVRSPIGDPQISGKAPASVALSVATELLRLVATTTPAHAGGER